MNIFGENEVFTKLQAIGNPLERLNQAINWEIFRPTLNQIFNKDKNRNHGGRKPYDYVMMFKILVLQRANNLSDDQTEYMILDRLSFRRFLELDDYTAKIPDAKTIWNFKNTIANSGQGEELFQVFERLLEDAGVIKHEGTLVDASFIEVPKQRNKRDENAQIKEGNIPSDWKPNKRRQKDVDARWTKKGGVNYFGYKNHVAVDEKTKLIRNRKTTAANVHDSQVFDVLLDKNDQVIYADSAYLGQPVSNPDAKLEICERAYRNSPLTDDQKKENNRKSSHRCRVEHVFGHIENSMGGSTCKSIGFARNNWNAIITSLTYNLQRFEQLCRCKLIEWSLPA
jgi:IS5 family transposase